MVRHLEEAMVLPIVAVQRRVDADELDAASEAEPVEQSGPDRTWLPMAGNTGIWEIT